MAEIKVELRDFTNNILGSLDITSSDNFPLSLTYQNFDVRDFNSRNGSFSKTFKIPATKNNNVLLAHIYQDGNVDAKNTRTNIPSTIYSDNIPIVSGNLKVTKILKDTNVLEYECNFLGDNMDWASKIKNLELKELSDFNNDSGAVNEGYIFENVQGLANNSRDFTNFSSTYEKPLYPLLSVGEGVSSRNQVTDADFVPCLYLKNIWDKIFAGQGYTVQSEFCNSDYFKSLIVPLNFERQSDLLNTKYGKIQKTDGFTQEIAYSYGNASISTVPHIAYNNLTVSRRYGYLIQNTDVAARYPFSGNLVLDDSDLPSSDTTGNVQSGTNGGVSGSSLMVKNQTGSHTLTFDINVRHFRNSSSFNTILNNDVTYKMTGEIWEMDDNLDTDVTSFYQAVEDTNNGNNTNTNIVRRWSSGTTTFVKNKNHDSTQNYNGEVSLVGSEVGRKFVFTVAVRVSSYAGGNGGHIKFGYKDGTMEIAGNDTISVGEDYSPIKYMLPKGKQSDFISGVSQMFNLQFKTDSASRVVEVEPYDYFYKSFSEAKNWTEKVDFSKKIEDEFINDIKSELIVKYKDASGDAFLERFNKKNDIDWGAYREVDSNNIFSDGTYKVENKYFSPSFNWYESDYVDQDAGHLISRKPFIPLYHSKFTNINESARVERAEKDYNIGARVLITVPVESGNRYYFSSESGLSTAYSYNTTGEAITSDAIQNKFCRANFFHLDNSSGLYSGGGVFADELIKISAGTYNGTELLLDPNLSFNDVTHDVNDLNSLFGQNTQKGLYGIFYSAMVEQLKQKPRIKSIYLNLNKTDISTLDFSRLVFIDGNYYRINKIIDFKPHLKQSTKVELVEYFNLGKKEIPANLVMNLSNGISL